MDTLAIPHFIFFFVILSYVLSSVWEVGNIFRPAKFHHRMARRFMLVGLCFHTGLITVFGIRAGNIPITNLFESLVLLVWCILFVFNILYYIHKISSLGAFLMPFVALLSCVGIPLIWSDLTIAKDLQKFWLISHIIPIFFGYASFAVAFIVSIMYLTQERQLKSKAFGSLWEHLPPLETLDSVMWKSITFGFPLLTLGLICGVFWIKVSNVLGEAWYLDSKVLFGTVTWLTYAALLHLRLAASYHGTKVACITIAGFVLVLITFLGTFFLGSQHGFQKIPEETDIAWSEVIEE
ncbi:MAG: cytochrome C assembly family protein [Candidatus Brocadiales bacterium]